MNTKPHSGQKSILGNQSRFRVVSGGRRSGKTTLAQLDAIQTAKQGGVVVCVLPNSLWEQHFMSSLMRLIDPTLTHRNNAILFPGGGRLEVGSSSQPNRFRGISPDSVVIDEADHCSEDVWLALRHALGSEGRALLVGTPVKTDSDEPRWFEMAVRYGQDPLMPDWTSWVLPVESNPFINLDDVRNAQQGLSELDILIDFSGMLPSDARRLIKQRQDAEKSQIEDDINDGLDQLFGQI